MCSLGLETVFVRGVGYRILSAVRGGKREGALGALCVGTLLVTLFLSRYAVAGFVSITVATVSRVFIVQTQDWHWGLAGEASATRGSTEAASSTSTTETTAGEAAASKALSSRCTSESPCTGEGISTTWR